MRLFFLLALMAVSAAAADNGFGEEPVRRAAKTRPGKCGIRPHNWQNKLLESLNPFEYIRDVLTGSRAGDRIVGGQDAAHGQYPWQGKLNVEATYFNGHYCGAVIISEYWLLTAAHCFFTDKGQPIDKDHFRVSVGNHKEYIVDAGEQSFGIAQRILHERYSYRSGTYDYDIALIKIQPRKNGGGISFNDFVQPACLPDSATQYTEGTMCMISGWGHLQQGGMGSETLQGAKVPLVSQSNCRRAYQQRITDRMVCAGYSRGGIDSCQGDSGGPLVCERRGVYTVFGLTSWGDGCAREKYLGVYTRVSVFLPWIGSTVKKNSRNKEESYIPGNP